MKESAEEAQKSAEVEHVVIVEDEEPEDVNAAIYDAIEESKKSFEIEVEQKLKQLAGMGFERELSLKAIHEANGNVNQAIEIIFSRM